MQFSKKSRARSALDVSNNRVRDWQLIAGAIAVLLVMQVMISCSRQNDITVHVPPDLSSGASFKVGTIPKPNVYLFASEVWRSINYWEKNGDTEMTDNLHRYSCYISEPVLQSLLALHEVRVAGGHSRDRSRRMSEITELKNVDASVGNTGAGTWEVDLDLRLVENLNGTVVKDQPLRYRVNVAADNSGASCNPFNMRIIGVSQPFRIEFEGESSPANDAEVAP